MKPYTRSKERLVAVVEESKIGVWNRKTGCSSPPQRLHISKTPMTTFDIRFEGVGHLTSGCLSMMRCVTNFGQPFFASAAPSTLCLLNDLLRNSFIASKKPSGHET
jgi:hypothetical protein